MLSVYASEYIDLSFESSFVRETRQTIAFTTHIKHHILASKERNLLDFDKAIDLLQRFLIDPIQREK